MVSGQLPPRKIVPRLGLGFGSRLRLVLGLGATRQLPTKKIAPTPVRVRVSVMVSFGVRGQFSSGEIVLIMQILRDVFIGEKCLKGRDI